MSDTSVPPPPLYDPALSFGARLSQIAREKPDAPAITDATHTLSWGEFDRRTNRIARGLAKAGVKVGDVVSIGLPNTSAYLEVAFGLWKAGATPQMLSYRLPKHEADAVLELAGAPILVTDGSVESSRPSFSAEALYDLGEDDSPLADVTAPVFKAATSGGSTGRPKLIVSGLPGIAMATGGGVYRIGPDDTCVMTGPLYHNAPFVCSSNALTQGAHVVLMPRFDAEETLKLVDRHKATWLYVVPTMMSRIWKLPEAVKAQYDVTTLRTVWHMAAPCPPWLKEAWIHWIGRTRSWSSMPAPRRSRRPSSPGASGWRTAAASARCGPARWRHSTRPASGCRWAKSARSTCGGRRGRRRRTSTAAPPPAPCPAAGRAWATSATLTSTAISTWPTVAPT
jgi:bile acid-coenzyme A ligase